MHPPVKALALPTPKATFAAILAGGSSSRRTSRRTLPCLADRCRRQTRRASTTTDHAAGAAVLGVRLEIDAGARAIGESIRTSRDTITFGAHGHVIEAHGVAIPAVVGVAHRIDADAIAEELFGDAAANAVDALLTSRALDPAAAAVEAVLGDVDTATSAIDGGRLAVEHAPPVAAESPPPHTFSQAPQFIGSVRTSTQLAAAELHAVGAEALSATQS